jgi:hypothetical protein
MNIANHQRIGALLLLMAATCCLPAYGQNADRFHVDMIIYANNDPSAMYEEEWPDNVHLRYPRRWTLLHNNPGDGPVKVKDSDPQFAKVAQSLRVSSRFKPLFQASWEQDLNPRKKAPAIIIQGGKKHGNHFELEGYIRVSVERYLHVDTNLWLITYGNNGGSNTGNQYLPRQPQDAAEEEETVFIDKEFESSSEYSQFEKQNPGFASRSDNDQQNTDIAIEQIVVMKQQRRMRSDELHFIDHPKFGAIIKITKIATPEVAAQ